MVDLDERRPWAGSKVLLIVGPGGAGKSALGSALAPLLGRELVDLGRAFKREFGDVSRFIGEQGYEQYKLRNSQLAVRITEEACSPTLIVTSSGFLTPDNPEAALAANRRLLATCYSVCLLPSRDLERTVEIIVARQVQRSFSLGACREEATIRARYPVYAALGDLIVFSAASPDAIAQTLAQRLSSGA